MSTRRSAWRTACGSAPGVAGLISALVPAPLQPAFTALANIPSGSGDTDSRYFQKSENWALFTHNIFHVTDNLDFTLGVRYTHESKKFDATFGNDNTVCPAIQGLVLDDLSGGNATARALAGALIGLACQGN